MAKDLLTRLADAGEEALTRLAESPGAKQFAGYANTMRDRMDELQRRVRGVENLEKRVTELEQRVATLEAAGRRRTRAASSGRSGGTARSRPAATRRTKPKSAEGEAESGGAA